MTALRKSYGSWLLPVIILVLALLIPAGSADAVKAQVLAGLDQSTSSRTDDRTKALREMLQGWTQQKEIPGAALLVAQQGRVVFREAYGLAEVEAEKPFTPETVVLTASTTKPLSATCLMRLVDQGRISLDDKVSKYLPEFGGLKVAGTGARAESPTIRQLLSHTSGLFGLKGASKAGMRAVRDFSLTLPESVQIIVGEELVAQPGQVFNYGGANFQVAARIAELVSGRPFDLLMTEEMLKPLGMKETFFKPGPDYDPGRAAMPYRYDKTKGLVPIPAYRPDPARKLILASGGLYSSLNDLAVFLQMHLNQGSYGEATILSPSAVARMQQRQTGGAKVPYGLGWFIGRTGPGGKTLSVNHPGLFGAFVWIDSDRELIGVFLTTSLWPGKEKLYQDLTGKVLELFPAP